jgi:hypothetical protein
MKSNDEDVMKINELPGIHCGPQLNKRATNGSAWGLEQSSGNVGE